MTKSHAWIVLVGSVIAGMLIMWAFSRQTDALQPDPATVASSASATPANPGAVKVEFFVMSQCPYGVQAVDGVKPTLDKLGADVDFTMDFIGQVEPDGSLGSMHGPSEVAGDMAQVCAARHAPSRYLEMVACQNKNMREVATNWESCAKEARLPVSAIKACIQGTEGQQLLKASFERAEQRGATGSPTIFINGAPYEGQRSPRDFLRAICAAHKGPSTPSACADLPPIPLVNIIVLGDKRCSDCETERYPAMLKSRIGNPDVRVVDYGEPEGRKIYDEIGGGKLPVLLFDKSVDADEEAMALVGPGLVPAGKYRKLDLQSDWNPECANEGGCKKIECSGTMSCRKETPNTLEVFVMSQCPYGVMALNAMPEVLANFKGAMDFRVHFIARGSAQTGFQALHGQPEVDENIRELCAINYYGKNYKFMDYVTCRNKNIQDPAWESCTGSNGIDTAKIKKCFENGEGARLHEADIAIANNLGIGGSPTWIVNGKHKFSGVDAETIRSNFCAHNKATPGCQNTLSSGSAPVPAGAGCGE